MFLIKYLSKETPLTQYFYSHQKLWEACRRGDRTMFYYYLTMCNTTASLNYTLHGSTALLEAVKHNSLEMAESLLLKGCDPHKTEPLLYVVTYGMTTFLDLFIKYGVDVTRPYTHDTTPLMVACFYSRDGMVRQLLPYYTSRQIRFRDDDGINCLMFALMMDNDDIVRHIISICPEIVDDMNYDFKSSSDVAEEYGAFRALAVLKDTSIRLNPSVIMEYF